MRTIAFLNQKGGVGKTTSAVNVAAGLARLGRRVLLVDVDPQAHATLHLGVETGDGQAGLFDVLVRGLPAREARRVVAGGLSVLPAHLDLVAAELELAARPARERVLSGALAPLSAEHDFAIVDCGPSLGLLAVNALVAAAEVVIPLQPHFLALQGLGRLLETVAAVRATHNPALRVAGVVFCMHERGTRLAQEVLGDVQSFLAQATPDDAWWGARVYDTCIRRNVKLAECPSFGQTIFTYAPGSHGADDYAALAREIAGQGRAAPASAPASAVVASTAPPGVPAPGLPPPTTPEPASALAPAPP